MNSSKPSNKANPEKPARRSASSWTSPEPGDVLNYAYLWDYQAQQGQTEGLKERPSVVVIAIAKTGSRLDVVVCPITTKKPLAAENFVELPSNAKLHLGLTDREQSFVVTSEVNRFTWPGPDIRPFDKEGKRTIYHGAVTPKLFRKIRDSLLLHKQLKFVSRD